MQETLIRSLGQDYPLEKEMATYFSICLEIPMDRGLQDYRQATSMGSQRVLVKETLELLIEN